MIKSFRHKGLRDLLVKNDASGIRPDLEDRCRVRLAALQAATQPEAMNVPGSGFHALHGKPKRYAVKVNGPWRITFEWRDGDAWAVDLEQYH